MKAEKNDKSKKTEIDLVGLAGQVWQKRRTVIISAIAAAILGAVIALLTPNTFAAGTIFVPQMSGSSLQAPDGLSGLASLAGIDLGSSSGSADIPPSLYPIVVESLPFRKELLALEVAVGDTTYLLSDYLIEQAEDVGPLGVVMKYTIGLPSLILGGSKEAGTEAGSDAEIYQLTEQDQDLFEILTAQLSLSLYEREGFVGLAFEDRNKYVSAQVVQKATLLLQKRIIEYRNQSARELLVFAERQYKEKKEQFDILQDSFALYKDRNLNFNTAYSQVELDRLSREVRIATSVLEQLASQVEQAKLKVNEDTPVFMIIEPVSVPFKKAGPKRALMVILFGILGVVFSVGYILVNRPVRALLGEIRGKKPKESPADS